MKTTVIIAIALSLCLLFGGELLSAVFLNSPLNASFSVSSKIATDTPIAEAPKEIPKPKTDFSTNPHGQQDYNTLTAEQRTKTDAALRNVEIAITEFLRSEVETGLMTRLFADELQKSIYQSLTINRSPLTENQTTQSGANL